MSVVRTASVAAVERVFIEEIQTGDWVVSTRTEGNGDPRVWRVHAKGFKWNQADGGLITLRSKAATGDGSGAISAPPRTPILRAKLAPVPIRTDVPDETENDEHTFRHKKCYANTRGDVRPEYRANTLFPNASSSCTRLTIRILRSSMTTVSVFRDM